MKSGKSRGMTRDNKKMLEVAINVRVLTNVILDIEGLEYEKRKNQ